MPTLLTGPRVHRVEVTVQTTDVDDAVVDGRRGSYIVARLEAPALLSGRCINGVESIVEAADKDDAIHHRRAREDIAAGFEAPTEFNRAF